MVKVTLMVPHYWDSFVSHGVSPPRRPVPNRPVMKLSCLISIQFPRFSEPSWHASPNAGAKFLSVNGDRLDVPRFDALFASSYSRAASTLIRLLNSARFDASGCSLFNSLGGMMAPVEALTQFGAYEEAVWS
jgi:hypothetical protein